MRHGKIFYKITTDKAPQAVASYSQGIVRHLKDQREVVTSGQLAFDPRTSALVKGGIVAQTKQVLANVGAILTAGGAKPGDIYQTDVVLADPNLFPHFNNIYSSWEWVKDQAMLPTRFTSVGGLLIPGALVEVRCLAVYPSSRGDIIEARNKYL